MKVSETLRAAKAMIDTPEKWCKFFLGIKGDGGGTSGANPLALRRCAVGALEGAGACGWGEENLALSRHLPPEFRMLGLEAVACWNNCETTKHADVMLLYSTAIEYAEARESTAASHDRAYAKPEHDRDALAQDVMGVGCGVEEGTDGH